MEPEGRAGTSPAAADRPDGSSEPAARVSDAVSDEEQGWSHIERREYLEAVASFDAALELNPDSAVAHGGRIYALRLERDPVAAVQAADKALRALPDDPFVQTNVGWLSVDLGR